MDRTTYIGSSDAIDIVTRDWHKTWAVKTGKVERENLDDVFKVQLGRFTENFHLDWTIRRLGEEDPGWYEIDGSRQWEATDTRLPFVVSHLDAIVRKGDDKPGCPVEAKHSSGARPMAHLIDFYMPQLQHHLLTTGADKLLFSVILANNEPERVWIGRSDEYIDTLRAYYEEFWGYVQSDTPPPKAGFSPEAGVITPKVTDLIPIDGMTRRDAGQENAFMSLAATFRDTKAAHGQHEAAKKEIKTLIAPTESEVRSPILTLKRNKKGSVLIDLHETEEAA